MKVAKSMYVDQCDDPLVFRLRMAEAARTVCEKVMELEPEYGYIRDMESLKIICGYDPKNVVFEVYGTIEHVRDIRIKDVSDNMADALADLYAAT